MKIKHERWNNKEFQRKLRPALKLIHKTKYFGKKHLQRISICRTWLLRILRVPVSFTKLSSRENNWNCQLANFRKCISRINLIFFKSQKSSLSLALQTFSLISYEKISQQVKWFSAKLNKIILAKYLKYVSSLKLILSKIKKISWKNLAKISPLRKSIPRRYKPKFIHRPDLAESTWSMNRKINGEHMYK